MDEITCTACGRAMSLRDLEHKSFREVGGRLYCPECVLKMGHPKRLRCPHCGRETLSILRQGVYTCTHCRQEIGGIAESGVIEPARPSGVRAMEPAPPAPPAPPEMRRPPLPRKKQRVAQVLGLALGVFVMTTLVLAALWIRAEVALRERGVRPAPVPGPPLAADAAASDEKDFRAVEDWMRQHPTEYDQGIEKCEAALKRMTDPATKTRAQEAVGVLRGQREIAAERDRQRREIKDLNDKLEQVAKEIDRLKQEAVKGQAVARAQEHLPPTRPTDVKPELTAAEKRDREARTAYDEAFAAADTYKERRKYGPAMEVLKGVGDRYSDTEWGRKAQTERERVRADADQEFRKLRDRAGTLVAVKDFTGARQLYAEAKTFDVPWITQIVEQKLAEIRQEEEKQGRPAGAEVPIPAAAQRFIGMMKTDKDPDRRGEAAKSLGEIGVAAAVPDLIAALSDEAWIVRSRAAQSLGKLGDVRAVPALVERLEDKWRGVAWDAHNALRAITKQDFAGDDKAKWLGWYEKNKPTAVEAAPPEAASSFDSTVRERRYGPDSVTFDLPEGKVVAPGTRLKLLRGGEEVCEVVVDPVVEAGAGQASGRIVQRKAGVDVRPGDAVRIQLPK